MGGLIAQHEIAHRMVYYDARRGAGDDSDAELAAAYVALATAGDVAARAAAGLPPRRGRMLARPHEDATAHIADAGKRRIMEDTALRTLDALRRLLNATRRAPREERLYVFRHFVAAGREWESEAADSVRCCHVKWTAEEAPPDGCIEPTALPRCHVPRRERDLRRPQALESS